MIDSTFQDKPCLFRFHDIPDIHSPFLFIKLMFPDNYLIPTFAHTSSSCLESYFFPSVFLFYLFFKTHLSSYLLHRTFYLLKLLMFFSISEHLLRLNTLYLYFLLVFHVLVN